MDCWFRVRLVVFSSTAFVFSSSASGEGSPDLYSSVFETSLCLVIFEGVIAETKCKIYTSSIRDSFG